MFTRLVTANAALALAFLAILLVWIVPVNRAVAGLGKQIATNRSELEFRYANRQVLRDILKDVHRLDTELPKLRALAVRQGLELEFVTLLETLAEKYGLTHQLKLTEPEGGPAGYDRELGIEIQMVGTFASLGAFLEDIERLPPVFQKSRITFSAAGRDDGNAQATFAATVSWPK